MPRRKPLVAGQFYPGSEAECRKGLQSCLAEKPEATDLPDNIVAGIVPHAGWLFSGSVAGLVFNAIKAANETVDTFVLFGAIHSYLGASAAVYDKGSWVTPLGEAGIDEELASDIIKCSDSAGADCHAHESEHSIEVQVPFIQYLFPDARIVPIMIPPADFAGQLGRDVATVICGAESKKVVCIGSTDLTHYGPRYGFYPEGAGAEGIKWARDVNDRAFIDLAVQMETDRIVVSAMEKSNACGAGAVAATVGAAESLGRSEGRLLAHTHSSEIMAEKFGQAGEESVGYAAIVY